MSMRIVSALCALTITGCQRDAPGVPVQILDLRWTKAAAAAYAASSAEEQRKRSLPEIRVYDAGRKLVWQTRGYTPGLVGQMLDRIVKAAPAKTTPGPDFAASLRELEYRNGQPATAQTLGARYVIVDYWAEWCVPCKPLERELRAWSADKSGNDVTIVRAETDFIAASKTDGKKIYMLKRGPDGKMTKVEM